MPTASRAVSARLSLSRTKWNWHLTPRTVAFHKYTIMETLGLQTGAELVQYAVERHIVVSKGSSQ